MRYTQLNEIADREGFIVAYPQGTIDSRGETFFNVGYDFNADSLVDDVDLYPPTYFKAASRLCSQRL